VAHHCLTLTSEQQNTAWDVYKTSFKTLPILKMMLELFTNSIMYASCSHNKKLYLQLQVLYSMNDTNFINNGCIFCCNRFNLGYILPICFTNGVNNCAFLDPV